MLPGHRSRRNIKWDRENLVAFGCKLRTFEAEAFEEYCESVGKTPYTVIKGYILECIGASDRKKEYGP